MTETDTASSPEVVDTTAVQMTGFRRSERIVELAKALADCHKNLSDPTKNAKNPFYNSEYADLAGVLTTIRHNYAEHGITFTQFPSIHEDGFSLEQVHETGGEEQDRTHIRVGATVGVTTLMLHSSGQWMEATLHVPVLGNNPSQDIGKAITYLRRYSVTAMGSVAQQDDDGNSNTAQQVPQDRRQSQQRRQAPRQEARIDERDLKLLQTMIANTGSDEAKFCEHFKVPNVESLPKRRYTQALQMLQAKADAQEAAKVPDEATGTETPDAPAAE